MEDKEVSVHCAPVGGHMPDNGLNVILQIVCEEKEEKKSGNREGNLGKLNLVMV